MGVAAVETQSAPGCCEVCRRRSPPRCLRCIFPLTRFGATQLPRQTLPALLTRRAAPFGDCPSSDSLRVACSPRIATARFWHWAGPRLHGLPLVLRCDREVPRVLRAGDRDRVAALPRVPLDCASACPSYRGQAHEQQG